MTVYEIHKTASSLTAGRDVRRPMEFGSKDETKVTKRSNTFKKGIKEVKRKDGWRGLEREDDKFRFAWMGLETGG